MTLRQRIKKPETQIRIGFTALILASATMWALRSGRLPAGPWPDGVAGLLYGVSIGCLLLGIRGRSRRGPSEAGP